MAQWSLCLLILLVLLFDMVDGFARLRIDRQLHRRRPDAALEAPLRHPRMLLLLTMGGVILLCALSALFDPGVSGWALGASGLGMGGYLSLRAIQA